MRGAMFENEGARIIENVEHWDVLTAEPLGDKESKPSLFSDQKLVKEGKQFELPRMENFGVFDRAKQEGMQ